MGGLDAGAVRALLRELDLPAGHWVVHAGASLALRGLIGRTADVDLVARGPAWERAAALGKVERGRHDLRVRLVRGEGDASGEIEVFDGWLGDDADALIGGAEAVGGVPCVRLEALLRSLRSLDRPRDRERARIVEAALGLPPGAPPPERGAP